jgi:hypothetical protein
MVSKGVRTNESAIGPDVVPPRNICHPKFCHPEQSEGPLSLSTPCRVFCVSLKRESHDRRNQPKLARSPGPPSTRPRPFERRPRPARHHACSCCKKFLRRSDPGALFDAGELVCYGCIPEWWPQRAAQVGIKEREVLEGKLVFWLRDFHHAETFKDPAKLPEASLQELQIVATCLECRGAGRSMGQERCRFCEGRGTVWVIVSRRKP